MKVSTKLCICMVLPFILLSVTETYADVTPTNKDKDKDSETSAKNKKEVQIKTGYMKQFLDHSDFGNTETFNQKYYFYKGDYEPGNPVFLLVGGARELRECDVKNRVWINLAKQSKALLIALEHRMYGESYPKQMDFSTKTLAYLNTYQAFKDLINFMTHLSFRGNKEIRITVDAKWIALGLNYGGTLAVLLRMKFSEKIKAAMAISAPLLPTVAFEEFYNIVENQCKIERVNVTIREAFAKLKEDFNSCENDLNKLKCVEGKFISHRRTFNFCISGLSALYSEKTHITFLFWSLTTIIARALEFGSESQQKLKGDFINILLDEKPSALERLGSAVKLVLQSLGEECLIVDYKSLIDIYKDTSPRANYNNLLLTGLGNRLNVYQHCSEWGQFKTTSKTNGIFADLIPIDFYVNTCKQIFGPKFDKNYLENAVQNTLSSYGGQKINESKVLFIMRDSDFLIDLGFYDRKPLAEITEEDSFAITLTTDDHAYNDSKWKFIKDVIECWSAGKAIPQKDYATVKKDSVTPIIIEDDDYTSDICGCF